MRKIMKLSLCSVAAVMLVAGCAKKTTETPTTQESTTAAPSTEGETEETTPAEDIPKGTITLGEYKGLELTKASVEVTEEEVQKRIDSVLAANPEYVEVIGRPAKEGDIVDIDYVGMKDGVEFEGGSADGYKLELGSGTFIPGFEEGIVGAEKGAELSLNITFPEDYHQEDLAGQPVVFDVTVNGIEEKHEAVLDDAFVQRISDFNTVDEFKKDTLADLTETKEKNADMQLESDALAAAVEKSEITCNEEAIENQYNLQMENMNNMVQMYGMTLDSYVEMFGLTMEDLEKDLRSSSESSIKQQLLIEAIAEQEKMELTDEDRQTVAEQEGMALEDLVNTYGQDAVDEVAMMYKVVKFLVDNAVVK